MPVIREQVVLPLPAFQIAWELAGGAEPHPLIGPANLFTTDDAGAALLRGTLDLLTGFGLADGDTVTPALRATFAVLAAPSTEVRVWAHQLAADTTAAATVAVLGDDALRLVTDHRIVIVEPVDPQRPAATLINTLPAVAAANVPALTVPPDTGSARPEHFRYEDTDDPLADPSPRTTDDAFTRLAELLAAPRDGAHQIVAARRTGAGRRRAEPVTVLDLTGRGRILTHLGEATTRRGRSTILRPGTRANLLSAVERALEQA